MNRFRVRVLGFGVLSFRETSRFKGLRALHLRFLGWIGTILSADVSFEGGSHSTGRLHMPILR